MALMRVSGCPVKCPECDSKQTWHPDFFAKPSVFDVPHLYDEVKAFMKANRLSTLLISGGEPGMYFEEIAELIKLNKNDLDVSILPYHIEIETTGLYSCEALIPDDSNHEDVLLHVNFSPKIGALEKGSNIRKWKAFEDKLTRPQFFPQNYSVKIVVDRMRIDEDLKAIDEFKKTYDIPNYRIFLMPLGVTREQIIKEGPFVLDVAFENGYNFSPRMHILMFDTKRLV